MEAKFADTYVNGSMQILVDKKGPKMSSDGIVDWDVPFSSHVLWKIRRIKVFALQVP